MHRDAIPLDALSLLSHDHRLIRALLLELRRLILLEAPFEAKRSIVETLAQMLSHHAYLEDELLFPAVADALVNGDNSESSFDQEDEQYLIEALEALTADYPDYDAKLIELSGQLEEHVQHEEEQLFPRFRSANIDLSAVGIDMLKLRAKSFYKVS